VLSDKPDERDHREPSVLHLLDLVLLELGGVAAGEADGVEELASRVSVAVALEVVGDSEEGSVSLGARVAVVHEALGLGPAREEEGDSEVGGYFEVQMEGFGKRTGYESEFSVFNLFDDVGGGLFSLVFSPPKH